MCNALETTPYSCWKDFPNLNMVYVIYCWLWVRKARKTPALAQSFKQGTATGPPFLLCSANTQSLHSWSLHNSVVPFSTSVLTALETRCSASCLPYCRHHKLIIAYTLCHLLTRQASKQNTVEDNHKKVKKKSFLQPPHSQKNQQHALLKLHEVSRKTFSCGFQDKNCFLPFCQIKLPRSYCCLITGTIF